MPIADIQEIIKDLRSGKLVIIVDDEERENEGDLIVAAEKVTPETINFMSKYGRGLICLTLTREHCQRLKIPLMVNDTDTRLTTNFTISIDAREGVSTGISAHDRARTVRTALDPNSKPDDIVQPGHIFPLMAQEGGVLTRAGHTEAGCDLARLSGHEPAAVIVEILNDDGTMARRADMDAFAAEHQLKIGTVEDLVRYRVQHEKTVHFLEKTPVMTQYGEFILHVYRDIVNDVFHLALTRGQLRADEPTLVRVHIENTLCDVIKVQDQLFSWSFEDAIRRVAENEHGVVVLLRFSKHDQQLDHQVQTLIDGVKEEEPVVNDDQWMIGIGGQILQDLGVGKMRLMHTPKRFHALGGFGLFIEEYITE